MLVDYHIHCIAHGDRESNMANYLSYLKSAQEKGIQEIGFAEHDEYLDAVNYDVLMTLKEKSEKVNVKIGVEMEMPNDVTGFAKLSNYPLDFVIASIHIIDNWMFDHPDYKEKYQQYQPQDLYKLYFQKLAILLSWDGYNIIGHMDLIKVFGIRSSFDFKPLLETGLKKLHSKNAAVEINTAGKYKPVHEIYPSEEIIKWLYALDVPLTLSSDAHNSQDVGRDIAITLELIKKVGYRKIATFTKRQRYLQNI